MALSNRLKEFLETARVRFTAAKHPAAYTAQEIAAAQHVPGRQLAKCVLVLADGKPVLAVLPATHRVALPKLTALIRAKRVRIGREEDIKRHFPDVEVGAMSPFGNLYQVPVIVDTAISQAGEIVFNGGSHTDTITMAYTDVARLVNPKLGAFGEPVDAKAPAARKRPSIKRPARGVRPRPKRSASRSAAKKTQRRTSRRQR